MGEQVKRLAIIPARGGSKGVPKKNLRKVAGKSLLEWAISFALESSMFDAVICSTDDPEIANLANACGATFMGFRPAALSGDRVSDIEVMRYEVERAIAHHNSSFDTIAMLQPTSPLRKLADLIGGIKMLEDKDLDAVWSLSPAPLHYHPLKMLQLDADNSNLEYFLPSGANVVARQQLTETYIRNGVFYLLKNHVPFESTSLLGARSGGYVIRSRTVNIDTEEDLEAADLIMREG